MSDRKAPSQPPPGAARPDPRPAPPMRVGRIEQLAEAMKTANPFESARLARDMTEEAERIRRSLADWERKICQQAAAGDPTTREALVRIIERLTGERFLS